MNATTENVIKHKVGLLNLAEELAKPIQNLQEDGAITRHLLSRPISRR